MRKCLLLSCFLPALAAAAGPVESAERLFQDMEYDRALKLARAVLSAPDSTPGELITAYRIEGLCLSARGRTSQAVNAFRRLLAIDPEYSLSPDISPKLAAPFYQAVAMSRNQKGIALVHTPPDSAPVLGGMVLKVRLTADPMRMVRTLRLRFLTDRDKKERRMTAVVKKHGLVSMRLPRGMKAREIGYFFEALNGSGGVLVRLGGKKEPFRLRTSLQPAAKKPGAAPAAAPVKTAVKKPVDLTPAPPPGGAYLSSPPPVGAPNDDDQGVTPWYQTWWFWTAVGVVAVGATTGAILASQTGEESGPVDYGIRIE